MDIRKYGTYGYIISKRACVILTNHYTENNSIKQAIDKLLGGTYKNLVKKYTTNIPLLLSEAYQRGNKDSDIQSSFDCFRFD